MRAVIRGVGSYLPQKILTNDDLAARVDTSDAWIRERTGMVKRHIVAEGETTVELAANAARAALASARMDAATIDAVIVGTSTPATTMPSVAATVQGMIGISGGAALDIVAACTGFITALATTEGLMKSGVINRAIVVGAESMSRIVDWSDRNTCVLFGDGAGAVILEAMDDTQAQGRGILSTVLHSDGGLMPILKTSGGVSSSQTGGFLSMQGQEVFRHGVEKMAAVTEQAIHKAGLKLSDIDWLVAHQANGRMIKSIGSRLKLPAEKCVITVDQHANTSAASIPLALDVAINDGRIRKGNIVAMPALGAGLTWGCCVVKW